MAPLENVEATGTVNPNCYENKEDPVSLHAANPLNASPTYLAAGISGRPRDFLATSSRNQTPVRPVYDDFPTAYLSITTGSGKTRNSIGTKGSTDFDEDRPVTPVLPLKIRRREQKPSNLANEPLLPPVPALVTKFKGLDLNFEFEQVNFTSGPSKNHLHSSGVFGESSGGQAIQNPGKDSPMLSNLKKVWDNISAPGIRITKRSSTKLTKWPRGGMENRELTQDGGRLIQNQNVERSDNFTLPASDKVLAVDGDIRDANKMDLLNHIRNSEYFAEPAPVTMRSKVGERSKGAARKATKDSEETSRFGAIHHRYAHHAGIESNSRKKMTDSEDENQPIYSGGLPLVDSNTSSSVGGSTVENFVQRYARSDELDTDEDSDEDLILPSQVPVLAKSQHDYSPMRFGNSEADAGSLPDNRQNLFKQSTAELRRQRRSGRIGESTSGQPPSSSLPQLPTAMYQRKLQSTSEGLGQSSSYGDTRNLLEFTQRSQCVSANDGVGVANRNLFPTGSRSQVAGNVSRNLNFRLQKGNAPAAGGLLDPSAAAVRVQSQKQYALRIGCKAAAPQNSLEREVSHALRRQSNYSTGSQESSIEGLGGRGFYDSSKSESSKPTGLEEKHASDEKPLFDLGFFDKAAIPPAWLGSQKFDTVRVPIGKREGNSLSTHPTQSSSGGSELLELSSLREREDDANDWETVGESGIISRGATIPFGVLGGDIGDTGSSLANISDTDDLSMYHAFSSTERFMEHPAQIGFSRDYHFRTMQESKIPVLLPANESYAVNGFPVNSYRPYQPNTFNYSTPIPLLEHQNPFTSTPPDFVGGTHAKGCAIQPAQHSQSQENLQYESSAAADDVQNEEPGSDDSSTSYNWMDDYGDPGPAIRSVQANFLNDERRNPYSQALNLANGNGTSGQVIEVMRTAGSSLADSSTFSDDADSSTPRSNDQRLREPPPSPYGANAANLRLTPRGRHLFVKGPPGAFYRDLRSGPDPRQQRPSEDRVPAFARHRRRSSLEQPYPTNKMRSLSLLTVERPKPPARPDGRHPNERRQPHNEFFFRSPLAEVKSRSWRNLYTRDQLVKHREAAEADGVHEIASASEEASQPSCGQPEGSWKRIRGTPHMFAWPREDSSIKTDTASRKAKISTVVLLICCLFPPVLLLYSIGRLDCLMMWWTKGEICSFRKDHKKWARRLGLFCVMCAVFGAAIGFCLHFSRPEISG